jgi:two-component system, OmpR family, alkaline phosphatase synthesis response regulator PhoP
VKPFAHSADVPASMFWGCGPALQIRESPNQMPNVTILIVDDEAPIRHVVGQRLRSAGYTVIEASDGIEALDIAVTDLPSLIVTDLQMSYMSGIELCKRLKEHDASANIPAILLTARGYVLSADQIAETNIRHVMAKPFSVREVLERIQAILSPTEATSESASQAGAPAASEPDFGTRAADSTALPPAARSDVRLSDAPTSNLTQSNLSQAKAA